IPPFRRQSVSKASANGLANCFEDLNPCIEFAVGFDNRPRSVRSRCPVKHLLNGFPILRHFFPVSPVFVCNLPLFVSETFTFLESPELLVGIDKKPELQDDRSKMDQMLLHGVDFTIRTPPLCFGAKPLHPLNQNTSVPASIKNRDVARLRHLRPESPKIMVSLFQVVGSSNGYDLVAAGIQILCEPTDITSFSCRIPAFVDYDDRNTAKIDFMLQFTKCVLGPFNSNIVLLGTQ